MTEIKKGTVIIAKDVVTENIYSFKVVVERLDKDYFRLVNINSNMIMSEFKSEKQDELIDYIKNLGYGSKITKILNENLLWRK